MNTWIRPGLLMVCMLTSMYVFAQSQQHLCTNPVAEFADISGSCGSGHVFEEKISSSPAAMAMYHSQEWVVRNEGYQLLSSARSSGFVVPVVVHVIHSNGMGFTSTNQVNNAIQQLNDAFGNLGPYALPNGQNTGIEFCLAKRDPQGNPTTGINIVQSPLTNLVRETQDSVLKNFVNWPSDKYLNIWVVHSITSSSSGPGIIGYASMPFMHGRIDDGIVIEAANFGTGVDETKVLVHEAGHYLGLFHTFHGGCDNNDCQADGDRVCDTPPDGSTANAFGLVNSCRTDEDDPSLNNPFRAISLGGLGDQPDQVENYMDYGDLDVLSIFSQGQVDRMVIHLQNFRSSLLDPLTCTSPCTTSVAAVFNTPSNVYTIGDTIWFSNNSTGSNSYSWTVDGTPFSTSSNPYLVLTNVGEIEVGLEAGNGQLGCTDVYYQTFSVECDVQASFSGPTTKAFPGQELSFTSNGSGNTGQTWLLDGMVEDTLPTFTQVFNQAGGYTLQIVHHSSHCDDTSDVSYLEIGSCGIEAHTVNWVFGDTTKIDFREDVPSITRQSGMFSDEGCTSMSDNAGNLMFYSNGVAVWNKDHEIMPNGNFLFGNRSSSQGVVSVPYPGQPGKYILFTTDAIEWTFFQGLRYNVIDMSLDSGRGDITAQKNVWIGPMSSEMIAAVQHENGEDYWLVTHEAFSNRFMIYEVTSAGVNTTPQIFIAGPSLNLPTGALKISPNRKKMSITCNSSVARCLLVMDFNPATGALTNPIEIMHPPNTQIYGTEFSPENSKVYFTTLDQLWQVDLSLGSQQAIINSKTMIASGPTIRLLGMQRAVNGSIYIATGFYSKLHEIAAPDSAGLACGFQWEAVDLGGRYSRWGLPNFPAGIPSALRPVVISGQDSMCQGEISSYSVSKVDNNDIMNWEVIGPGQLLPSPFDSLAQVQFNQDGPVKLVCSRTTACGISRDTMDLMVLPAPAVSLGEDLSLCTGDSATLYGASSTSSLVWSDGSTGMDLSVSQPGTYWAETMNAAGCITRDSILVSTTLASAVSFDLGPDTAICEGLVLDLDPQLSPGISYRWQDGSNLPSYAASTAGTYYVDVTNECGLTNTDTIHISLALAPVFSLGPDQDICPGDTIELIPGADFAYLQWQDDSNDESYLATQPGLYWLQVTTVNGCSARDSIELTPCIATSNTVAFENTYTIYPNPSSGSVNIEFDVTPLESANIVIHNGLGQVVFERKSDLADNMLNLDLQDLKGGVYYLSILSGAEKYRTSTLVISR